MISTEIKNRYNELVKSPNDNIKEINKCIEIVAKENGYNSPLLYHGTNNFGFTKIDINRMDDKRSFFATDAKNVAESYLLSLGAETLENIKDYTVEYFPDPPQIIYDTWKEKYKDEDNRADYVEDLQDVVIEEIEKYVKNLFKTALKDSAEKIYTTREIDAIALEVSARVIMRLFNFATRLYDIHSAVRHIMKMNSRDYIRNNLDKISIYDTKFMERLFYITKDICREYGIDTPFLSEFRNLDSTKKLASTIFKYGTGIFYIMYQYLSNQEDISPVKNKKIPKQGIYLLYADLDNMIRLDCKKTFWNEIPLDVIFSNNRAEIQKYIDTIKNSNELKYINKQIDGESDPTKYLRIASTRSVSLWAQKHGYSGVILDNLIDVGIDLLDDNLDDGISTVYIFLNPSKQLKSADPITVDDSGNIIPIEKRFNRNSDDIRESKNDF